MKSIQKAGEFDLPQFGFTEAQRDCLLEFAKDVACRSGFEIRWIGYELIGSEDLENQVRAAAMLRSLQSQDWNSVSSHNALAGRNNLLLGIVLRSEGQDGRSVSHWVAMRSPYELMESPALVAAGEVREMPLLKLRVLFSNRS